MTDDSAIQRRQLAARVERWTTEAKRLADAGQEAQALELYRRAADVQSGDALLQQRTAELARKLNANDHAITYLRRASDAFIAENLAKRAVGPLRLAWGLAIEALPSSGQLFDVTIELMQLHRRLGFAGEAAAAFERTNAALRKAGLSEIDQHVLEEMERKPLPQRTSVPPGLQSRSTAPQRLEELPPSSVGPPASSVGPPASSMRPRSPGSSPDNAKPLSPRERALARLLGRR